MRDSSNFFGVILRKTIAFRVDHPLEKQILFDIKSYRFDSFSNPVRSESRWRARVGVGGGSQVLCPTL